MLGCLRVCWCLAPRDCQHRLKEGRGRHRGEVRNSAVKLADIDSAKGVKEGEFWPGQGVYKQAGIGISQAHNTRSLPV